MFSSPIEYIIISIKGILTGDVGLLGYNQAMWFLPMIFLSNILFYGIIKLSQKICKGHNSKNLLLFFISVIIFFIGDFALRESIRLWSIDIALLTMPFNTFGYLLFKYSNNVLEKFKAVYLIPLSIILILVSMTQPYKNLASRAIGNPIIYFLIGSLAILILFKICNILVKYKKISNILIILGENSLIIMAYHMVIHSIIYSAIVPRLPADIQLFIIDPGLLVGLTILMLELAIPVGIGMVLHRKNYNTKIIISIIIIISLILFGVIHNKKPENIISDKVSIGSSLKSVENFHIDGWVEQEAKIEIQGNGMDSIIIEGDYTGDISGSEKVYIMVNGEEKLEFDIKSNRFILEIPVNSKSRIMLDIKTNFTIDSGADVRNLAFLIRDIKLK